ncbi:MAG: PQQ-binding-like beta-propeller repeat protein, partial [Aggregatilineales bacterium]
NGSDLEDILRKTKSLPLDKILEWAIDLCDVLQYLHTYEPDPIIFRDMKPANIMVDSLGKVRLIDFGIAKVFVKKDNNTTIGTEGYSAPEQYKGKVNPLSDIYSLGATLHHVISRKDPRLEPPFSFAERPLMENNPDATAELNAILEKALQFEPDDRYQDLLAMKDDLETVRFKLKNPRAAAGVSVSPAQAAGGDKTGLTDFIGESGEKGGFSGGIKARWFFKTEDGIRSSPVAFDNIAFVGSYDTNMWAIDLEKGDFIWKYPTEGGIASSPIIDRQNRRVLFGSDDFTYSALNYKTGTLDWTFRTKSKIRSTGTIAQGHVFFGSDDGNLYALMSSTGRNLWNYDAGAPIRSRPAVTDDRIIFGTEDGQVTALELNGERKWSYRTRKPVTSSPIVDDEQVCYAGCFDGSMYAIDADNGYSMWKLRTGGAIISSPSVVDNLLYFGSTDGYVWCVNTSTGKEKWKFQTDKPVIASPLIHEGTVYIGSADGYMYAIDAKKGSEKWKFQTEAPITSTPFVAGSVILFGSMDFKLYALPLVSI